LFGARRPLEIGSAVRQAAWLALALTLLGSLLLYFPGPLLRLTEADSHLTGRTLTYLRVLSLGLPASLLFRIYTSLSNGIARPRFVMALQLTALLLKIPANAWFIFGGLGLPALGGVGCALASTLINWSTCLIALGLMWRHPAYRCYGIFSTFCWPSRARQIELLKLGVPMGLSYLIEVTAYAFLALFIARFGATQLAGHQIAANLGAVLYMTPLSIGIAASTLVAQHLGANEPLRARTVSRVGLALGFSIALCYALALVVTRRWVIAAYTPDAGVAAAAMPLLLLVACYHPWDALQCISAFILRGHKIATIPTVIYAVALWGVGMGGGYYLGFNVSGHIPGGLIGASGFWFASCFSVGVAALMLVAYWHWKFNRTTSFGTSRHQAA